MRNHGASSTQWYVDRVRRPATRRCRLCRQPLVFVDGVGWVDSVPGDSYDICGVDPFGNHEPGPVEGLSQR